MRAVAPTDAGEVTLEGFGVYYETFGDPSAPTVLFFPSWQIVHSRMWKMQVPHFARFFHVVTMDIPGNGKAERTTNPAAFEIDRVVDYGVGLLDHLDVQAAAAVGLSMGAANVLWMAARYPERVRRAVLIGAALPHDTGREDPRFWQPRETYEGWQKRNAHYWREDFDGWLAFFFSQACSEPHSTKQVDDLVSWGRETTADILIQTTNSANLAPELALDEVLDRVRCPVLLIHGTEDRIRSVSVSRELARARPDFQYLELVGSGHVPTVRDPVKINQAIADFLGRPEPRHRTWRRAMRRDTRRVLFVSSPIGLGHVQRDLAIAREFRKLVPGVEIDWLAQHPVTQVLQAAGERIHPMSASLASESAHWEESSGEHELHCFYAFREMDEILLANFMVFLDVVRETPYDLWIGDEAWEVDHYLHENPELKTAPYAFITDFVGWLPMDRSLDSREAFLTADYNAEMIEHVERFGRVRDRALYIGDVDDLVPEAFGPGLPSIRHWTEEHFIPVGYVVPFDPGRYADTPAVRASLGYEPDQPLVVCAAGGTATGRHLLQKVIDAWPLVHQERPDARCVVVTGPRTAPESLVTQQELDIKPYVHDLFEHLAAADLGVVQGGLSTTMELAVNRRPFLYFPLKNHCEQIYHVKHRLDRYRAGRRVDYHEVSVDDLAGMMLVTMGADTSGYREHTPGGAERAARELAALL
jgi:pimeloyl-ACP methyl ester carboxylesterase/UDP:flavonoid glycosyltransferase YjiC (YdhE family)